MCVQSPSDTKLDRFGAPFAGRVRNLHTTATRSFITVLDQQVFSLDPSARYAKAAPFL